MAPKNQWIRFVSRLIRMTRDGELEWKRNPPPPGLAVEGQDVDFCYAAPVRGRTLRIYEACGLDPEWRTAFRDIRLEFVDAKGRVEYRPPKTASMHILFREVQRQCSGVDDFLDAFLAEHAQEK